MYSSTHPPRGPPPSTNRGESARHAGRGTGQHSTPPPPPSPTWAEIAKGGISRDEMRGQTHAQQQHAARSSTPAHSIYTNTDVGSSFPPLPSAYSQYLAWVRCRMEGIPARLVLDTDGATEEVSFWFRPNANGGSSAAAHVNQSGKRRRERARRVRRREERRKEAEERCLPPAMPSSGVAGMTAAALSSSPPDEPPSTEIPFPGNKQTPPVRAHVLRPRTLPTKQAKAALIASRATKRAAVLAKRRGTTKVCRSTSSPRDTNDDDAAIPESLREAEEISSLNITMDCLSPPPPPSPPSPSTAPSLPEPASSTPPPPPPMSSRFPRYYRKVVCRECFYEDHDYRYYHCMSCHENGSPREEIKLRNIKKYAVSS